MKKIARRCAIVLIGVAIVIIIGLILNNKVRSDGKDTSADIVYAEEMTNALTTEEILDLAEGSKENSEPDVDHYRYLCNEEGMDSEWITYNEYVVEKNGMWTVQVKDAAGNLSETEIMVNNIDQKAPVIRNIKVK